MNKVKLYVQRDEKEEEILFEVRRMVNAGYTGRNQEAVRSHIEELKKEKIPAPDSIPTAYEVISKLLYFVDEIEVQLAGADALRPDDARGYHPGEAQLVRSQRPGQAAHDGRPEHAPRCPQGCNTAVCPLEDRRSARNQPRGGR